MHEHLSLARQLAELLEGVASLLSGRAYDRAWFDEMTPVAILRQDRQDRASSQLCPPYRGSHFLDGRARPRARTVGRCPETDMAIRYANRRDLMPQVCLVHSKLSPCVLCTRPRFPARWPNLMTTREACGPTGEHNER